MERRTKGVACLLLSSWLAPACVIALGNEVQGSGDLQQEERSVSGVRSVAVGNQGDLVVEFGEQERLVLEAESNLLEHLEVEQRGDRLVIGTRGNVRLRNREPIRYYLTVTELEAVETASSGDIEVAAVQAERFEAVVSSSGDIHIGQLIADDLQVVISSSGDIDIDAGRVESQEIRVSSSGDYDASGVQSRRVSARLSSSGNVSISASDELEATLSSSGGLRYRGDPGVRVQESSSGRVRRR